MKCKNCLKGRSAADKEALFLTLQSPKPPTSVLDVATDWDCNDMSLSLTKETLKQVIEVISIDQVQCKLKLVYSKYKWRLNFVYKAPNFESAQKIELGVFG